MPLEVRLDRASPLHASATKGASVTWPLPLDAHVDYLVDLVESAHERTTRRELVAAIVFAAPRDGRQLSKLLKSYRAATVADVTLAADVGGDIAVYRTHRPGPRRRA
jgi:hypothetical protein